MTQRITVETLASPRAYTPAQIRHAITLAGRLDRGPLVLTIPPPHDCHESLTRDGICRWCHRRPQETP